MKIILKNQCTDTKGNKADRVFIRYSVNWTDYKKSYSDANKKTKIYLHVKQISVLTIKFEQVRHEWNKL